MCSRGTAGEVSLTVVWPGYGYGDSTSISSRCATLFLQNHHFLRRDLLLSPQHFPPPFPFSASCFLLRHALRSFTSLSSCLLFLHILFPSRFFTCYFRILLSLPFSISCFSTSYFFLFLSLTRVTFFYFLFFISSFSPPLFSFSSFLLLLFTSPPYSQHAQHSFPSLPSSSVHPSHFFSLFCSMLQLLWFLKLRIVRVLR